jgi:hypothetical protein
MPLANIKTIFGSFKGAFSTSEVASVWNEGKFVNYELQAICNVVAYFTVLPKQYFGRKRLKPRIPSSSLAETS